MTTATGEWRWEWRVVSRLPDREPTATDPVPEAMARAVYGRAREQDAALWVELQRRPYLKAGWVVVDWFGVKLVEV